MILLRLLSLLLAIIGVGIYALVVGFIYVFLAKDHDPQWIICVILWSLIGGAVLTASWVSFVESR